MRASLKTAAVALAMLSFAGAATSSALADGVHHHAGMGAGHAWAGHGGGHGWGRHGYGWGGPGLALGLFGAAVATGIAVDSCVEYRPLYDAWGNYLGRRAVNVCY